MPNNNIHVLTKEELDYLKNSYTFELKDNLILTTKNHRQTTVHGIDKSFSVNCKICQMKISVMAIDMWKDSFKDKYSLIEVQDAINRLVVSYQTIKKEEVEDMLKKYN